ncbi:glycoside hydrolase family 55 protein [Devosia neptuniae]|uniref:Glycoside hydrolase family 55 protein n=1 Tax=Devosia neptuniae TaxID=191302 RepID=A0ABY6CFE4_9HYPH|nr:glycoside hydrolase family 55 protein [Devosia neptuniae]UXN70885.1 glycoside hydrolase family 55 protein [Devosia neptuniae]
MALSIDQVYRDWNTPSVPSSGDWEPKKPEIRALLKQIQNSGGLSVTRNTFAALSGVTPPTESYMGIVLDDPDATKNGYYSRVAAAWVWERGFPDTVAQVVLSGSGTVQTGAVGAGVNPASTEIFFAKVVTPNTSALTLSISGGAARSVVNLAGNPLTAGEWTGMVMFYLNDTNQYQLLIDAGAAAAAAQSAADAASAQAAAEAARDAAEGAAETVVVARYNSKAGVEVATVDLAVKSIELTGYYAGGDGGRSLYRRVAVQPSHAGKIRSTDRFMPDGSTNAGNGGWWEISEGGMVNLRQFGCKCDGTTDDSAAFQACVDYAFPRGIGVIIPSGSTRITTKISSTYPVYLVGERVSQFEWPASTYYRYGSVIVSEVPSTYALDFGAAPGSYAPGTTMRDFKIIAEGAALSSPGSGIRLSRGGWDGQIDDVVIQDFPLYGLTFDYMQDMKISGLSIIKCGTKGVAASLFITGAGGGGSSNILVFDRLHIEDTEFMMYLDTNTNNVVFNGAHFECGEYPPEPWLPEGHYTEFPTIDVINGLSIDFNDCVFGLNSVEWASIETGVPEANIDYGVKVGGVGIRFNRCGFFERGSDRSQRPLYIDGTFCEVNSCEFRNINTDKNSIVLSGVKIKDSYFQYSDSGTATFAGIFVSNCDIEGNTFYADNAAGPTKTVGYIIENGETPSKLGDNAFNVSKFFRNHTPNMIAKGSPSKVFVNADGVTAIDLLKYPVAPIFVYTTTVSVASAVGAVFGQEVIFINKGAGTVTLASGSTGVGFLRGSVSGAIGPTYTLTLREFGAGYLHETARSF